MTTTYIVTNAFAVSILEIKNPWFIVNEDYVVGVYEGRAAARTAKATGLAGKIVSLKEITFEIAAPIEDTPIEDTPIEDTPIEDTPIEDTPIEDTPIEDTPIEDTPIEDTPIEDTPIEDTPIEDTPIEDTPIEDTPIEPKTKTKTEPKTIENHSTVEKPCRLVWDLADAMVGARRKDVIAAAESKGVAFYTARTQYQLWAQVQKEMAERAAATK